MKKYLTYAAVFVGLLILLSCTYQVQETEQVVITQLGQIVGKPVTEAGLHFKLPIIQEAHSLEKRVLEWDSSARGRADYAVEMPTKDKLYIIVQTFGRWTIDDAAQFFVRLRDLRSAESRLSDILNSETRNTVARHNLVELVRTDKNRKPVLDPTLKEAGLNTALPPIEFGRAALEKEILDAATPKLAEYGIKLLDIRLKRVNYRQEVAAKIFQRMIGERQQIASRYRSEGEGEAAKINGQRERDLKEIESDAYRKVQAIEGEADAKATTIYASAFNQNAEAREFYTFKRSLETYALSFTQGTTLVMSSDSPFLRYLRGAVDEDATEAASEAPVTRTAPRRRIISPPPVPVPTTPPVVTPPTPPVVPPPIQPVVPPPIPGRVEPPVDSHPAGPQKSERPPAPVSPPVVPPAPGN